MQRVAVVDYGMGNLRSVSKAIEHVGGDAVEVAVTSDAAVIDAADRVVFPGQGAMRDCMAELAGHGLVDVVRRAAGEKPFLGICMGLQALLDGSDEHLETPGLGIIPGRCLRFPDGARDPRTGERLKIPHMGWNQVRFAREHPVTRGVEDGARFYFVHSYHAEPAGESDVLARTDYGVTFTCAIARDHMVAVQFHPEKSQRSGLALLEGFLGWDGLG